jgi:hypothetical protein
VSSSVISFGVPFLLSVLCFTIAGLVLPPKCTLFVSNVETGLMCCDALPDSGCHDLFCDDPSTEFAATIVAWLGIGLLFLPMILYVLKDKLERPIELEKIT